MKISVIVTTFNGERYILEQLESLKNQSRKIDEVIIADDMSSDGTYLKTQEFIEQNQLFDKWILYQNTTNKGFMSNYFTAMKRATGDIIFFCDQDDIWLSHKIEHMANCFENNGKIMALICKENRIDDQGNIIIKHSSKKEGLIHQINFSKEVRTCMGSGHLLAIRHELYSNYATEIEKENLTFDIPFCIMAASFGSLYLIDEYLVNRRIHENNTSGITWDKFGAMRSLGRVLKGRKTRCSYYQYALKKLPETFAGRKQFSKAVVLLLDSIKALEERKIFPILREFFSFNPFLNKKSTLAALYVLLFKRPKY